MGQGYLSRPLASKFLRRRNNDSLQVGSCEMQGSRATMEDRHTIEMVLDTKIHPHVSFFGVYDGHSGLEASTFCESNIHKYIAPCELKNEDELVQALVKADAEFFRQGVNVDHGTTCLFALVQPHKESDKSWTVTVGNIGDSRALLFRAKDKSVEALSQDHRPEHEAEKRRIYAAGGSVCMGRVDGQLAMSRAIGDFCYKKNESKSVREQKVIAVPGKPYTFLFTFHVNHIRSCLPSDIVHVQARPGDILLLACDGIFEQLDNEAVAKFVMTGDNHDDPARLAAALCDYSLKQGSRDNHTVIVVRFRSESESKKKEELPEEEYIPGEWDMLNPSSMYSDYREAFVDDAARHGYNEKQMIQRIQELGLLEELEKKQTAERAPAQVDTKEKKRKKKRVKPKSIHSL